VKSKMNLVLPWLLSAAWAFAGPVKAATPKLEYRLPVGKKLCYTRTETRMSRPARSAEQALEVWVARENRDGSRLLVVRSVSSSYEPDSLGGRKNEQVDTSWAYAEMSAFGRTKPNYSLGAVNISRLFVPLPGPDTPPARLWAMVDSNLGDVDSMELLGLNPLDSAWHIRVLTRTRLDDAYRLTRSAEVTIDVRQGLPVHLDAEASSGFGRGAGKSMAMTVLDSVVKLDTVPVLRMARELAVFYSADSAYGEMMGLAEKAPQDTLTLFARAESILIRVRAGLKEPAVLALADAELAGHEPAMAQLKEDIRWRASKTGIPAPDWQLLDLEGKSHKLADYLGKVVILDYWYRGCPWCIRAMPSLNALAEAYKDKPVAVIGMNIDDSLSDARFVVQKLRLGYTNLQAKGIPEKYGVTGYPTLFVIGPDGIIRDIHVGYAPDLREKLEPVIESLLPKPKQH
jgi:thiol-disulfide isomerase/thioredoxin